MPDEATTTDHRRAIAERNVAAILDAVEALLLRGAAVSTAAVAREAGVSRVTVYAHFPTRDALLEAVVDRAAERAMAVPAAARLDEGTPEEALDRLVETAWAELDRSSVIAQGATEHLSPAAMARAHAAMRDPIAALVERGRREGAFRTDLPTQWLVTTYFALVHACGDDVRRGDLAADDAVVVLRTTLGSLWAPPGP